MKARAIALAVTASMLAFAPARVRAQADVLEPDLPAVLRAPFRLVVNHADRGEIVIALKDGDIFVKHEDLESAGLAPLEGKDEQIEGQRYLSLRSVSPPLRYAIDEPTIELRVDAPAELLPKTRLDLAGSPPDIIYGQQSAGIFNYATSVNDRGQYTLYEEMGASIRGNLLFSSAYISSEQAPRRGLTNFTIDDRKKLRRIVLGDALVTTGALGSGRFVGGATLSHTYALDPYAIKTPHLGYEGATLTPATLDVYVNGARVYAEQIQPGTFQLDNLRVGGGRGTATYVIRDIFGHERTISDPFYISSGTLAKGLHEYTYSAGMLREDLSSDSWGYHKPGALGQHRVGISDAITLGGRGEMSDDRVSGGPSIEALTPIGLFEAEIGGSGALFHRPGIAGFLSYTFSSRLFGAGAFGRLMSNQYSTLSLDPATDRALVEAGAFESLPIGERLSVALQQLLSHYRDRGTAARVSGQLSWNPAALWTALLSASHGWIEDGRTTWELFLSVSYSFADGHSVSVAGRMNEGGPSAALTASKSLPIGAGYGYRASAVIAEHSGGEGLVQYQTLFGRYGLDYRMDEFQRQLTFDAAGSLVLVPGVGLFPSLPVQDGFGLIRVPGVPNVRGYVNNQELGRTDRNGNLLVPNMLAYYGNRLGIASEDVPIQYAIPATEMTLAPPYRGIAIANFRLSITRYFRGRVTVDDRGQRVVPAYGELHVERATGEAVSPLGEQGEFELEALDPGRHVALVDHEHGRCEFVIDVPDSEQILIELGELTCHTSR